MGRVSKGRREVTILERIRKAVGLGGIAEMEEEVIEEPMPMSTWQYGRPWWGACSVFPATRAQWKPVNTTGRTQNTKEQP